MQSIAVDNRINLNNEVSAETELSVELLYVVAHAVNTLQFLNCICGTLSKDQLL